MIRLLLLVTVLAACGDDSAATPDAPRPSVLNAMVARGTWMEDFIWDAGAYKACTGCEHLTVLEFQPTHYQLHVFMRPPGQPASATEQCTATMMLAEDAIAGFAISDRAKMTVTVGANTCGFSVGSAITSVFSVVSSDAGGAGYVAGWDMPADLAGPFPGYAYSVAGARGAYPMKPCATAPGTLCEPACNLTPKTDCGLPAPQ